ncbi:hypothetical protein C8046_17220 [Serinibacter arcticus]|uniref:D-alanyl-D-alanine carboxypeptidase-like core domain-containing protein n=1 Tax=Serinibacter arcticus TaxID=1655435 RepID=A0A2U1ZYX0_9MICO|nr:M15 family metallopeptidase [Serinibacter arcticus]PWD52123.1 hypothetical protein C8046_17220 [Serinibacter arcticus]
MSPSPAVAPAGEASNGRRSRLLTAAVAALAVALTILVPGRAEAVGDGTYTTRYDGTIYSVAAGNARALGYDEWVAAGRPTPTPAPTIHVSYPWSSTIYASTWWGASSTQRTLTYDEWVRAGRPAPSTTGWVPGSYVYTWATSPDVGLVAPDGGYRWLTAGEWAATGHVAPVRRSEGFAKLSWSSEIAYMTNVGAGQGRPIGYATWARENFPRPLAVQRFAGDQFYRQVGSDTVWYAGPTMNRAITYAEYAAAGFPAVRVDVTPGPAGSVTEVVNKQRSTNPLRYVPGDLRQVNIPLAGGNTLMRTEAAGALERLAAASNAATGRTMTLVSAYRSYDYQANLYNQYVRTHGQAEADRFSARPGHSEHQLGLGVDIGEAGSGCGLGQCFGATRTSQWVAQNAWRYGFVVRYPAGMEHVTGYIHEPWHLRYVGVELSSHMQRSGVTTLEQIFGL